MNKRVRPSCELPIAYSVVGTKGQADEPEECHRTITLVHHPYPCLFSQPYLVSPFEESFGRCTQTSGHDVGQTLQSVSLRLVPTEKRRRAIDRFVGIDVSRVRAVENAEHGFSGVHGRERWTRVE